MRWSITTLFLFVTLSSCGQVTGDREVVSEGSESNIFIHSNCQEFSGTVCGQPPMPVCPQGMGCIQVMPAPISYANDCELKKANAAFIQNGSCPATTL